MRVLCRNDTAHVRAAAPVENAKCLKTLDYLSREISLMIAASALRKSIGVVTSNIRGARGFRVRARESSVADTRPGVGAFGGGGTLPRGRIPSGGPPNEKPGGG